MVLAALVGGCESAGTDSESPLPAADVAALKGVRGTLVVYTATFDEGIGDQQYFLRTGSGTSASDTVETRLYFATNPKLLPGTPIVVRGEPMQEGLRVDSFDVEEEQHGVGLSRQPLIGATPYKPRTFGFVLVDTGKGVNLTKEEAQKKLFGVNPGDKSVKQYYNEVSYGTQDITGEVLGPFMYPMTTCDTRGVATKLKPMIGMYDHYLWYFGQRNTACQFSGLAEGGQPNKPTNDTWYNGSAGCVVLVQEPGHNFGMMHSSAMTCTGGKSFADDPDNGCTHNEYGDRYDPMGGACNHMNAWQKVFEGWLQKCNGVKIKSSGMYTLQPLELACDGPQVLQIPFPKVRPFGRSGGGGLATTENLGFYYLELRTPRGFDDTIRASPVVQVRVAEDFRDRMDRGRHTWILDTDPATRTIDGLTLGKTFTDPAGGVSFTVMALTADSATIQVTVPNGTGPAKCLDDTTYDPVAAAQLKCAGLVGPGGTMTPGTTAPGTGGPAVTPPPKVEVLMLVDAATGQDIRVIEDMAVLDLNQLPPNLTIRADTDPMVVGSVSFRIDAGLPRADSMPLYTITTDTAGKLTPWTLALGAHTVNAVAFDMPNGMGRGGDSLDIDFTLTRGGVVTPDPNAVPDGRPGVGLPVTAAGAPALAAPVVGAAGAGSVGIPPTLGNLAAAGSAAPAPPPVQNQGCACRVPGAGIDTTDTPRSLALTVLALSWFVWRRRSRKAQS